jgi:salicylate hydroxylase
LPDIGQGCNVAIEDAEAIGFLFRDVTLPTSSSTYAPAPGIIKQLEMFQALRMQRAHFVQFASRHAGGLLKGELKEKAGEFDRAAFGRVIYGYTGFEDVYKAHLAEKKV